MEPVIVSKTSTAIIYKIKWPGEKAQIVSGAPDVLFRRKDPVDVPLVFRQEHVRNYSKMGPLFKAPFTADELRAMTNVGRLDAETKPSGSRLEGGQVSQKFVRQVAK